MEPHCCFSYYKDASYFTQEKTRIPIDDIFTVWTHWKDLFEEFHQYFNNFHPSIKQTLKYSTWQINFLDTEVKICNSHLSTTLYWKPTNCHSYLHTSCFHPSNMTRSSVYSQVLCSSHICSDSRTWIHVLRVWSQDFQNHIAIQKLNATQINKARLRPCSALLPYQPQDKDNRVSLLVTYIPQLEHLRRIMNDLRPLLEKEDCLKVATRQKPVLSYRQSPSIKLHLFSHRTPPTLTEAPGHTTDPYAICGPASIQTILTLD
ncbi:uncharacterized protein LOC102369143 [Alligator sinensis]|uniref:Uncharacterized protein LOC102369143 n=1 Tax=Alligator sinensis TaxID=38654 RepID=A0A1U7SB07_ALLSI|nr:uncharacterized protein LOC102369143 [Alligator sinensis]